MIKLGIGLPAFGLHLDVGHAAMWLGLGATLAAAQDKVRLQWMAEYHINGVDLCRNTILYDAMQANCDWVFMCDADTFHRSTADAIGDAGVDIIQMIRDADRNMFASDDLLTSIVSREIALIGAPVRGRGEIPEAVVYNGDRRIPLEELLGKLTPVTRIGAAFVAVNLKWLREHWPKGPWFLMEHDPSSDRPRLARGEDYRFCDEARKRGGAIVCDGRFVPEHVDRRRLVGEIR
jgi:hypothetical protein